MSKVAIVGCGAMGSVYAGLMQRAGHEVHGVCLWADHVEAVVAQGLRVHGASGDHTVRLTSMATTPDGIGVCDLVVLATKAFDVVAAARSCPDLIGPAMVVQSIQNGLGSPEQVARVLGADRLAVGVVGGFGASVPEPGVAHHHGMEMIRFGSFATLPRPEKLIMNVAFSGTTCLTGLTIGEVLADPAARAVAEACAREAVAIAGAAGVRLEVGDPIAHVRALGGTIPGARPSMLLDMELRRRGEVDAILGEVARRGEGLGVDTPVVRTVADLVRARESAFRPGADEVRPRPSR